MTVVSRIKSFHQPKASFFPDVVVDRTEREGRRLQPELPPRRTLRSFKAAPTPQSKSF